MSDTTDATVDIAKALEEVPEVQTFDVLSVVKGRTYPETDVVIYTDHGAAHKASILERRINDADDGEAANALESERSALLDQVRKSALTFRLRGLSSEVLESIKTKVETEFGTNPEGSSAAERQGQLLIAAHIVRVTNADGAVDSRVWTHEDVEAFANNIPNESFNKFQKAMDELTFKALYFEQSGLNPDF